MTNNITGLHHVTALTSDAQQNIDFYTGILGLRLEEDN
jgi:glyoxalase family protein